MRKKKLVLGLLSGSMAFFLISCASATEKEVKNTKTSASDVSTKISSASQTELEEILEKTIPDTENHFEANDDGLEAFVRYVEEFPPLVELSMIDKIREKGRLYFTEDQMKRLNKALDETTAL